MLKRRDVLAAGLVLPMAAQAAPAKHHSQSRVPLVGAWSLIDAMTVQKDGRTGPWNDLPRPYSGLIVYEPNGMMSVQIASARPPLPEDVDFKNLPADQQLAYLHSYYAYYGRYEFDRAKSVVTHFVVSSLDPTEIGIDYRRKVKLVGDVVTLTTIPRATSTSGSHNVLSWRRV
ncbi:lipocalin-like domain-containing protein [Sphingomonas sp. G124]|uniref:Lipocalin-like domain-containing protein n=1 Tax=Sphingomonas cremea TaxID=2904799 RepID=A0A9X1TVW8_9SPHN|nr:lipocalin-like domain-containing protein [Sphingomonas cremea]MCF2514629.1 lipocalin-like domain-containing protein [Sphingomonas cremea]